MTGETSDLKPLLAQVAQGRSLSEAQAEAAFDIIMSGNATPSQIGLRWLLAHDAHILLIPGTTTVAHLEENIAASRVQLDPQTIAELDSAAMPES